MRARDIMRTDVPILSPRDTVCRATRLMLEGGYSALPVADTEGGVAGVLTEWDLLSLAIPQYMEAANLSFLPSSAAFPACDRALLQTTLVHSILRPDSHAVVSADDPVVEVARVMVQGPFAACAVVEGRGEDEGEEQGPLVGFILYADLLRLILEVCREGGQA